MVRQRKSWSSSSADGALNEYTWQPCGLTPDITCLMAPSLPAASMAWKISSTRPAVLGVELVLQPAQALDALLEQRAACSLDVSGRVSPGSTSFSRNL